MARLKTTVQINSSVRVTRSKTSKPVSSRSDSNRSNSSQPSCRCRIRRYRPGSKALKEIRRYQKGTGLLLPKLPFCRVVRDVAEDITYRIGTRFEAEALECLQVAAEAMLVHLFEDSVLVMVNSKRVTLMAGDLEVVRRIRGL